MALDVKEICLEMYQKLYEWHTKEIVKLDLELSKMEDSIEKKRKSIVEKRLIVERKRIRKIYPDEFSEDEYDSRLGTPTL
ncbi:MAG: hypothetical protein R3230_02680 [Nitrosopumilaceae archaeon]|nr:hypothetical protein [Nitrosopumilaceae archaeon]